MYKHQKNYLRDPRGVTLIKYGLIAALIAIVVVGSLSIVGTNLDTVFTEISTKV